MHEDKNRDQTTTADYYDCRDYLDEGELNSEQWKADLADTVSLIQTGALSLPAIQRKGGWPC